MNFVSFAMGISAFDPLAQTNHAIELKIFENLGCDTSEFIDSREFIRSHSYGEIFKPRHKMREKWKTENPKFVCSDGRIPFRILLANMAEVFQPFRR